MGASMETKPLTTTPGDTQMEIRILVYVEGLLADDMTTEISDSNTRLAVTVHESDEDPPSQSILNVKLDD